MLVLVPEDSGGGAWPPWPSLLSRHCNSLSSLVNAMLRLGGPPAKQKKNEKFTTY